MESLKRIRVVINHSLTMLTVFEEKLEQRPPSKNFKWKMPLDEDFNQKKSWVTLTKKSFSLEETSAEQVLEARISGDPHFVLKLDGKLFLSGIINAKFMGVKFLPNENHLCGRCMRCCAASDEEGGCSKVRGAILSRMDFFNPYVIENSSRIENLDFISTGYETINTGTAPSDNPFVVLKCTNRIDFAKERQTL